MKPRDLANLLNRAAAAIETPDDLTTSDKLDLVNDLITEALNIEPDGDVWKNNSVQFPRLLAEIWAVGLESGQYEGLEALMDLPRKRIYELFERADAEWDRIKPR